MVDCPRIRVEDDTPNVDISLRCDCSVLWRWVVTKVFEISKIVDLDVSIPNDVLSVLERSD